MVDSAWIYFVPRLHPMTSHPKSTCVQLPTVFFNWTLPQAQALLLAKLRYTISNAVKFLQSSLDPLIVCRDANPFPPRQRLGTFQWPFPSRSLLSLSLSRMIVFECFCFYRRVPSDACPIGGQFLLCCLPTFPFPSTWFPLLEHFGDQTFTICMVPPFISLTIFL